MQEPAAWEAGDHLHHLHVPAPWEGVESLLAAALAPLGAEEAGAAGRKAV